MTSGARGGSAGGAERIGRYEVELQLGQSRLGRVLLARDPVLERQVAIKMRRDDLAIDPAQTRLWSLRLKDGARAAAALRHPGILTVHDMGDDERAGAFVVSELAPGGSLRERLAQGRLARNEAMHLTRSLGAALSYAHAAGVVHGNVKPENILLTSAPLRAAELGTAGPPLDAALSAAPATPWKLTDFGAAEANLENATASAVGTTAPEGLSRHRPSAAADQFALAAVLYEALAGVPAFAGGSASSVADSVRNAAPAPVTSMAPELRACPHIDAIFDRALSKDPRKRFASCEAFAAALATSLEASYGPIFTPISQSSIVPRSTRRWQNLAGVAAVIVICALVLLGRQSRSEGVSLRSVAADFATAVRPAGPAPARDRLRPPRPSSTAAAAAAATGRVAAPVLPRDAGPHPG